MAVANTTKMSAVWNNLPSELFLTICEQFEEDPQIITIENISERLQRHPESRTDLGFEKFRLHYSRGVPVLLNVCMKSRAIEQKKYKIFFSYMFFRPSRDTLFLKHCRVVTSERSPSIFQPVRPALPDAFKDDLGQVQNLAMTDNEVIWRTLRLFRSLKKLTLERDWEGYHDYTPSARDLIVPDVPFELYTKVAREKVQEIWKTCSFSWGRGKQVNDLLLENGQVPQSQYYAQNWAAVWHLLKSLPDPPELPGPAIVFVGENSDLNELANLEWKTWDGREHPRTWSISQRAISHILEYPNENWD